MTERGSPDRSLLWRFWTGYVGKHRLWYGLGLVCLVATNLLTVAIPGFVEQAIDALEEGRGVPGVRGWALAMFAAGLGIVVVRTLSRTLFFNPGRTVEFDVKNAMFARLVDLPRSFYETMGPGDIMSRGTNDTNSVRALAGFATLQLFNVVLLLALTLFRMILIDVWLTLVCAVPLGIAALILRHGIRSMYGLVIRAQKQIALLSDRVLETYNGVGVLQTYGAMAGAAARFDGANEGLLDIGLGLIRIRSWLLPVVSVVGSICVVLLLVVGGPRVVGGDLTLGALAALSVYVGILVTGLTSLGWLVNSVQRGWVALERVHDVLNAEGGRPEAQAEMPRPGPRGYAVDVRDLTFRHPVQRDGARETPALDGVSFHVAAGETVGIFGLTGAGKSTLLDVLARVYDPPTGTVWMDGVDMTSVPVRDLWRRVGYVTQEPYLFSRTVLENIALEEGRQIADSGEVPSSVLEAVADAALSPDMDVLPKGLRTIVGERGITLSGGQRQRVALARAFYREFDLLLLDDVLSAVDHATEAQLIDAIYRRIGGEAGEPHTALIVSHRISVLAKADRILVLDEGRIVGEGKHADLVKDRFGPYARAWALQQAAERLDRAVQAEGKVLRGA